MDLKKIIKYWKYNKKENFLNHFAMLRSIHCDFRQLGKFKFAVETDIEQLVQLQNQRLMKFGKVRS